MDPVIMHMDMDAFFASVEELSNPTIRGKPVVVAGPGERSIITTASYEARKFGIRTGMTVRQAKILCRDSIVIRSDYRKYSDASGKIMSLLETFTPEVETTSVDEAFLDCSGIVKTPDASRDFAVKVKKKIYSETGLTCSIGVAHSRLLAKLASGMNKPDGLTVLSPERAAVVLKKTPVQKLCGIGPVTAKALNDMGIRTCDQLGRYPVSVLRDRFGSMGTRLSEMGRGEGSPNWDRGNPARSIGHSVTLEKDLSDRLSMKRVLQTLSEMVGRRVRRYQFRGRTVALTWRYEDFSTHTRRTTLPSPICLTKDIYRASGTMLDSIDILKPVRLIGVSLSDMTLERFTPSLLPDDIRGEEVQRTIDIINDKYGEFTLTFGDTVPGLGSHKVISPSWRPKGIRNSY